jgi:hypothetical protein
MTRLGLGLRLAAGARSRGLLTQPLKRLRKTYALVPHRQRFGPVHQAVAARPRVAATGPGAPATRLAAQTPELEQLGGKLQISAPIGGSASSYRRKPVSSEKTIRAISWGGLASVLSWIPAFAGMTARHARSLPRRVTAPGFCFAPSPLAGQAACDKGHGAPKGTGPCMRHTSVAGRVGAFRRATSGVHAMPGRAFRFSRRSL